MSVTRHGDPDAFLATAEPLLTQNAAIRSLIGGIADRWRTEGDGFLRDAYVATYADGDAFGLALLRRGGHVLVENSAAAAARAFAADVPDAFRGLTGVGGEQVPCEAFAAAWDARFGTSHHVGVRMRHHVLTEVAADPVAPGAYRIATPADAEWLEARSLVFADEVRLTEHRSLIVDGARRRLGRGAFRIWEDGAPVAFAGWSSAGSEIARIAPVYTEPSARNRGYATALVAGLARELLASGRRALFLLTDLANPTSNAIYARIGFRPLSDAWRLDFVAPARGASP
jgi:GNAT superfamily N-acetyltransferase